MKIDFNINDYVYIKLTDIGRAEIKRQREELIRQFPLCDRHIKTSVEEDSEGWSRWQMWNLIRTFGSVVHVGLDPAFATNIKIELNKSTASLLQESE